MTVGAVGSVLESAAAARSWGRNPRRCDHNIVASVAERRVLVGGSLLEHPRSELRQDAAEKATGSDSCAVGSGGSSEAPTTVHVSDY